MTIVELQKKGILKKNSQLISQIFVKYLEERAPHLGYDWGPALSKPTLLQSFRLLTIQQSVFFCPRSSIRGSVRLSVGPPVRPSVGLPFF